jgi:arylsulfatase A-like enzyme
MKGWDNIRKKRHQRLIDLKLISPDWPCSPRNNHSPAWNDVRDKEWEAARMACYAAQVTIMDEGIGRILETLHRTGIYEDTVIFFLSDNGGCGK